MMTDRSLPTKRRDLVKIAGAVGVAGMAGCLGDDDDDDDDTVDDADDTDDTDDTDDPEELTMWIFDGQAAAEFGEETDAIIEEFEDDTGITVNLSSTPYGEFLDRIQTSLEAGEGPDIIQSDVIWTGLLADNGWLEPVGDRYEDADFALEDFFEASIETCEWDDEIVGVPFMDGGWGAWYYNADMLEEAGYDPMDPPMETWDDMLDVARDIRDELDIAPIGIMGADEEPLAAQWSGFYFTTGADSWLSEDGTSSIIGEEDGVRTTELFDQLVEEDLVPAGTPGNDQFDVRELFGAEQIAMYQVGSWERDILIESFDIDFGITHLPMAPGGRHSAMYGGWNWTINADSENKDAAWDLITRFTTNDAQLRTAALPPALIEGTEERFGDWEDPLGNDAGQVIIDQLENAAPRPVHPRYPSMSMAVREELQALLIGEKGPEEAIGDASDRINDLL